MDLLLSCLGYSALTALGLWVGYKMAYLTKGQSKFYIDPHSPHD